MILVVGNINFDILFPLAHFPGPHEKMTCDKAVTGFGGSAANTAHWLGKLGAEVSLAGAVGDDYLGEAHLKKLCDTGVRIDGVCRVKESTGIAVVFSLNREKRMIRVPGANLWGEILPEVLKGCRLVYLSGADTKTLSGYAALARERNIPVFCGWHGAGERGVAALADGFILNADELNTITGLQDPMEGVRALDCEIAAVTLPVGGCLVSRGIDIYEVPANELDPVDRTGGGDAFAAGFLSGLAAGLDVRECGRLGNELAGKVIMGMGARPEISIPSELISASNSQPTADS